MNTATIEETETIVKKQPPYNLILLNDDDHTESYVISMCMKLFGYSKTKGKNIALEVHNTGRSIIYTGSFEVVELKQEQVHSFGRDIFVMRCKGSMTAVIEKVV